MLDKRVPSENLGKINSGNRLHSVLVSRGNGLISSTGSKVDVGGYERPQRRVVYFIA